MATPTRRERLHNSIRDEIKAIARQQMEEGGTASISLNGIARAMQLTSPALYRYYASRDELITALIVDTYHALADTLGEAAQAQPVTDYARQLFSTSLAYREWALAHPTDFLLIYGNPIPGYEAPPEQVMEAAQRVYAVFLGSMQAAYTAGYLPVREAYHTRSAELCTPDTGHHTAHNVAPIVMVAGIAAWTKLHGMVMLELLQHLHGAFDDFDAFYRIECQHILEDLGLRLN